MNNTSDNTGEEIHSEQLLENRITFPVAEKIL